MHLRAAHWHPIRRVPHPHTMAQAIFIGMSVAVVVFAAWYSTCLHFNRRRGLRALRWLRRAIAPHGHLDEAVWIGPGRFHARLTLSSHDFLQPSLDIKLAPRQMPLRWALWRWHGCEETVTFQANLTCPPGQSLEIGRSRWTRLTDRSAKDRGHWPRHAVATLYLSTQPDWEPQIAERMSGALSIREFEFLAVSFRPRAPHFSVTFLLKEVLRRPAEEVTIFDNLRELAAGSRTSRM
jgi:hypothetical protein